LNCTWQEKSAVLLRMLAPGLDLAPAAQQRWPARLHEKARGLHVAAGAGAALLLPAWLHPPTGSLFGRLMADGWCWFVPREEYCWLVMTGCWWLIRSERKVLLAGG
jgi:hypothetical protein